MRVDYNVNVKYILLFFAPSTRGIHTMVELYDTSVTMVYTRRQIGTRDQHYFLIGTNIQKVSETQNEHLRRPVVLLPHGSWFLRLTTSQPLEATGLARLPSGIPWDVACGGRYVQSATPSAADRHTLLLHLSLGQQVVHGCVDGPGSALERRC